MRVSSPSPAVRPRQIRRVTDNPRGRLSTQTGRQTETSLRCSHQPPQGKSFSLRVLAHGYLLDGERVLKETAGLPRRYQPRSIWIRTLRDSTRSPTTYSTNPRYGRGSSSTRCRTFFCMRYMRSQPGSPTRGILVTTGTNSVRFAIHPNGYRAAVKSSEEYAAMSRKELDIDEPSVDALQALLLLVVAFTAAGKGKKAYMAMSMSRRPFLTSPP